MPAEGGPDAAPGAGGDGPPAAATALPGSVLGRQRGGGCRSGHCPSPVPVHPQAATRGSCEGSDGSVCETEQWGKSRVAEAPEA